MFLRPGHYMVQVSRTGYTTNIMSVTVPEDSGRRIVSWLAPADRGAANRLTMALLDMKIRVDTAPVTRSRLFTHEDVTKLKLQDLREVATVGRGRPVSEDCLAYVDGGPATLPIWKFSAADIEMAEVYITESPRQASRTASLRRSSSSDPALCTGFKVYVWLRQ